MLFNSFTFIFAFMPIIAIGYYILGAFELRRAAIMWLASASLLFYAWGDAGHLPVLLISIVFNFTIGRVISAEAGQGKKAGLFFAFGVIVDVMALAYFKYINFFIWNISELFQLQINYVNVRLPIGISFFTFTQIAFLTDCYRGETKNYKPRDYLLFVTYFPHLIAGPILLHKEIIPQFSSNRPFHYDLNRLLVGFTIFTIGLAKKVVLADGVAPYADAVFLASSGSASIDPISAWIGALAYTMQLYFDFSGYCDMAIGLSHMLGFRLPVNFWSPYKSASIIEFWRRWHMTLSRFLADHIYKPLGGNRTGQMRRYVNLFITMLIGGMWHGAGWTFVLWGALHGTYLSINHAWRHWTSRSWINGWSQHPLARFCNVAITFLAVVIAWVLFRAPTLDAAVVVLSAMIGYGSGPPLVEATAVSAIHLLFLGTIVFFSPNVYQLMRRYSAYAKPWKTAHRTATWRLNIVSAVLTAFLFVLSLLSMLTSTPSPFLYFQF